MTNFVAAGRTVSALSLNHSDSRPSLSGGMTSAASDSLGFFENARVSAGVSVCVHVDSVCVSTSSKWWPMSLQRHAAGRRSSDHPALQIRDSSNIRHLSEG